MDRNILFIFIDGLGVGEYDKMSNPCTHPDLTIFNNFKDRDRQGALPFRGKYKPIDASLGVSGIPQSATGQTSLLTGINAAQYLGKHLSGFPNLKLRQLLDEKSLLTQFTQAGKQAAFINAYRPVFFEKGPEALIRFLSVTSIANWKAGLKFYDFDDLRAGKSIYHDFTNAELINKGIGISLRSPDEAGEVLAKASAKLDFCLYEYFISDKIGHKQNKALAEQKLLELETFVTATLEKTDLKKTIVLLTSDHGNIENLSIKSHTTNQVPFLIWGSMSESIFHRISSIEQIAPSLLDFKLK